MRIRHGPGPWRNSRSSVIEGGRHKSRTIKRAQERNIGLGAEHQIVRELKIVAGLIAADQARDAVGKEHTLQRQGIGAGAEAAAAIADMAAEIEAGPVKRRRRAAPSTAYRQRWQGCRSASAQSRRLPTCISGIGCCGSWCRTSSANIPAISLVITADLPALLPPKKLKSSTPSRRRIADVPAQSQSGNRAAIRSLLQMIRNRKKGGILSDDIVA